MTLLRTMVVLGFLACLSPAGLLHAQDAALPAIRIPVEGQLLQASGEPRTGTVVLRISIYASATDPNPLWVENQIVTLTEQGWYAVDAGASQDAGLPQDLFTNGSARWLGVAVDLEQEGPRSQLLSTTYAAKAASADTIGGRPVTDFVLTSSLTEQVKAALDDERDIRSGDVDTAAVTTNYIQKGAAGGGTTDSTMVEVGGNVGVGTASPGQLFEIAGLAAGRVGMDIRNTSASGAAYSSFRLITLGGSADVFMDNDNNFRWDINGIERMRIGSAGNLGIGTTSPLAPLKVAGYRNAIAGIGRTLELEGYAPNLLFHETQGGNHYRVVLFNSSQSLHFERFTDNGSSLTTDMVIKSGDVGIGTANPATKLHVAGAAKIDGALTVDGNIAAKYQDVAEWVDAVGPIEPGTVVMIDQSGSNRVMAATGAYNVRVAGAVSPQPGLILGERSEGRVLVAQSGRVRVKADAAQGPITPGDLLVTSPLTGHAMKSVPARVGDLELHRPGTVLGKALEPLAGGTGEILVLLTLQ